MTTYVDAGSLDQRLTLLSLQETSPNAFAWVEVGKVWANVTQDGSKNYFSSVGLGARNAKIIMRRSPIDMTQALRWGSQHLFLTSITQRDRMHWDVSAALVDVVTCAMDRTTTQVDKANGNRPIKVQAPTVTFPGVLTEKYQRSQYNREDTHAKATSTYILVTPKTVVLEEGDVVTVQEGPAKAVYNVQGSHVLDRYKNEYEIVWSRDV